MRLRWTLSIIIFIVGYAASSSTLSAQRGAGAAPRSSPSVPSGGGGRGFGAPSGGASRAPSPSFSSPRSSPSRSFSSPSPSRGFSSAPSTGGSRAPSVRSSPNYSSPSYASPSYGGSGRSPSSGASRSPSVRGGGQPSTSSGTTRYAPYGTNRGPSLYKGGYSNGSNVSRGGSLGVNGRGYSGSTGAKLAPSSRGGTSPTARAGGNATAGARGFEGFGRGRGASAATSSDYRSQLAQRVGGAAAAGARAGGNASRADRVPSSTGAAVRNDGRAVNPGARAAVGNARSYDRSVPYSSRAGYDHVYHNHHHHRYDNDDHIHFSFFAGYGGFGFGIGYTRGHHPYFYGYNHCYPIHYYPHYYAHTWFYPYWGSCYYPYYWSYAYFPYYRTYVYGPPVTYIERRYVYETVVVDGVDYEYRGRGYLPSNADDPYVDPKDMPDTRPESSPSDESSDAGAVSEEVLQPVADTGVQLGSIDRPFVEGVETGTTSDDAIAKGDDLMKGGKTVEAAEAYRTAYQRAPENPTAALRLSVALFKAGDFQLSSWALTKGVGSNTKSLLDHAVLMDDLLGGPTVSDSTRALERYLIERPNDEASNLLLGAVYSVTGRPYAAHVVLTRLKAADYETGTVNLYLKQAEQALKK